MSKTIEIFSVHKGRVNVKVKGEPRTVVFERKGPHFAAMCDHDEAAVFLELPGNDFWKEGATDGKGEKTDDDKGGKTDDDKGLSKEVYAEMKSLNQLKPALAKTTDRDLIAELVKVEAESAEPREKWLAAMNTRLAELQ